MSSFLSTTTVARFTAIAIIAFTLPNTAYPGARAFEGIDDLAGYQMVAKAFVGLNPVNGDGSGFVIKTGNPGGNITSPDWPTGIPDSKTGRNNLCTCDCKAGPDGVGCVGWGGIAFRYSSMLWKDPKGSGMWEGQMQANQNGVLNFIGTDIREYPGGEVIYNVACTDNECAGILSGVFRQSNKAVSCAAGIEDKVEGEKDLANEVEDSTTCWARCQNAPAYGEWVDYCEKDAEDPTLGFRGRLDSTSSMSFLTSESNSIPSVASTLRVIWGGNAMLCLMLFYF